MTRKALIYIIQYMAPSHRRKWAAAMQSEILNIEHEVPAILFGLGCILACCRFQMENIKMPKPVQGLSAGEVFVASAFFCGAIAGTLGLIYLVNAGAPRTMIMVNGLALAIGILAALIIRLTIRIEEKSLKMIVAASALVLVGTALGGHGIEGANRWLAVGPYAIQTSLILLPLVVICYARLSDFWSSIAVICSGAAMAIQPDRAMAGMLFLSVAALSFARPSNGRFAVSTWCAIMFVITMILPDRLSAVPFVDHILWTAFDISILTGASLWIGCFLLLAPVLFVRHDGRSFTRIAFGASWFAVIAAAAFGAYPTPVIGYGASAILGYFLSLAMIEPKEQFALRRECGDVVAERQHEADRLDAKMGLSLPR